MLRVSGESDQKLTIGRVKGAAVRLSRETQGGDTGQQNQRLQKSR